MAEKIESNDNEKTNEAKPITKNTTKRVATGNTKKIVQKRSSSVAGKASSNKIVKKAAEKKVATPKKEIIKEETTKIEEKQELIKEADDKKTKKEKPPKEEKVKEKVKVKEKEVKKEKKEDKKIKHEDKKLEDKSKKKELPKQEDIRKVNKENNKTQNKNDKKETEQKEVKNEQDEKNKEDKQNKQLQTRGDSEIEEAVVKEIEANKEMPEIHLHKINTRVFQNICLAIIIMFYLNFIVLGFINIENAIFITDLKVFSLALVLISIGVFEYAYKKDSGRHVIHGIEILILAFTTMALIYINLMWADKFVYLTAFIIYVFAIYYVIKSVVIYNRMRKEYFVNEMKEMIKK